MTSIVIDRRFCGPPKSANGGYVCGMLAGHIDGCAEITLLAPPPLGQRLDVVATEHGVDLRQDETTLARGRRVHVESPEVPVVPLSEAEDAVRRSRYDESRHPLPMCFVCGPERAGAMGCASTRVLCRRAPTTRPERSRRHGCRIPISRTRMAPLPASSSGLHWTVRLDMRLLARSTWG